MKNIINKFVLAAFILFCSSSVSAQQVTDTKPKTDERNKPAEVKSQPPAAPLQAKMPDKSAEQAKPIVPGGAFKPVETGNLKLPANHTDKNKEPDQVKMPEKPVLQPAPAVKEVKPEAATPQAKPVQQAVKQQ